MTQEEIVAALLDDMEMPYLQDWQARDIVDFVLKKYTEELPTIKGWVARCKWACPEELYFYKGKKPVRCGSQVEDAGGDFYWDFNEEIIPLPPTMFPDLKWEDDPIEVELQIRPLNYANL